MNEFLAESRPLWLPLAIAFIVTLFLIYDRWAQRMERRERLARRFAPDAGGHSGAQSARRRERRQVREYRR